MFYQPKAHGKSILISKRFDVRCPVILSFLFSCRHLAKIALIGRSGEMKTKSGIKIQGFFGYFIRIIFVPHEIFS